MHTFQLSNQEQSEHISYAILKCPLCCNTSCPFLSFKGKSLLEKISLVDSLSHEEILKIIKQCINICGLKTIKNDK